MMMMVYIYHCSIPTYLPLFLSLLFQNSLAVVLTVQSSHFRTLTVEWVMKGSGRYFVWMYSSSDWRLDSFLSEIFNRISEMSRDLKINGLNGLFFYELTHSKWQRQQYYKFGMNWKECAFSTAHCHFAYAKLELLFRFFLHYTVICKLCYLLLN